jgi:hypothetical protein
MPWWGGGETDEEGEGEGDDGDDAELMSFALEAVGGYGAWKQNKRGKIATVF